MNHQRPDNLHLSTSELVCLLQAANVAHLAESILQSRGAQLGGLDLESARKHLVERGLLDETSKISSRYQEMLAPLFHPDTMLMLVRIRFGTGQEALTFLQKSHAILLYYSIPNQDRHHIEAIDSVDRVRNLMVDLYDIQSFPPVRTHCSLHTDVFEQARSILQQGEIRNAIEILKTAACPEDISEQLVAALHEPLFSGSVAVLKFDNDTADDGDSLALVAGEGILWHIYRPDITSEQLTLDADTDSLTNLLDKIIRQFLGDKMLDEPLNKTNVITFTLSSDELAYCLHAINASAQATSLLQAAHPDKSESELTLHLKEASEGLVARGWCKLSSMGLPLPVKRLESAIFPLARYDYVVQAEITRPDLHSIATINVLNRQSFTSLLHPNHNLYVLEHGLVSALSAYVSKLFLDFGEGKSLNKWKKHKINYALVSVVMEGDTGDQSDTLVNAGFNKREAEQFAVDASTARYRGSIIRINDGNQTDPELTQQSIKPVLLLLRGPENSWLFEFSSADEEIGSLQLVDRATFEKALADFLN